MNVAELKQKIAKMEAGLNNPNISGQVRENLEQSLAKAKGQLAASEKEAEQPKESPAPQKKITKKAFYAIADKSHSGLTRNGLDELPQNNFDKIFRELVQLAEAQDLNKKDARDYVESYIARHIPAGSKAKPQEAPKPKPKATVVEPAYSWRSKVDPAKLKPVVLHCQHYSLPVTSKMAVKLKGSGGDSITVNALPGEHLIFDDKGYLVFIMNKGSFARKCNENTRLQDHQKEKHLAEQAKKLQTQLEVEQKEVRQLKDKIRRLEQPKKAEEPAAKVDPPKPKSATKPAVRPATAKKKAVCTLAEAETGRRVARISKFFLDEAEAWNNSTATRKITKIMQTKGEKQEVIIEVADYRGFATGLATLIGGSRKYYRLCIDTFNLTSVDKPKPGSYKVVIPAGRMKEVYTTRGSKQYKICLKAYRELLQCSFEGSCTPKQSAKWKKLYHECGDLVAKLDKNPTVLRNFHQEVKRRRKAGEKYSDAMSRVAGEIKGEAK